MGNFLSYESWNEPTFSGRSTFSSVNHLYETCHQPKSSSITKSAIFNDSLLEWFYCSLSILSIDRLVKGSHYERIAPWNLRRLQSSHQFAALRKYVFRVNANGLILYRNRRTTVWMCNTGVMFTTQVWCSFLFWKRIRISLFNERPAVTTLIKSFEELIAKPRRMLGYWLKGLGSFFLPIFIFFTCLFLSSKFS